MLNFLVENLCWLDQLLTFCLGNFFSLSLSYAFKESNLKLFECSLVWQKLCELNFLLKFISRLIWLINSPIKWAITTTMLVISFLNTSQRFYYYSWEEEKEEKFNLMYKREKKKRNFHFTLPAYIKEDTKIKWNE